MRRAAQCLWVLESLADLESDFSAIHGIDIDISEGIYPIGSAKFFRLADRMVAYKGVIQLQVRVEHEKKEKRGQPTDVVPLTHETVTRANSATPPEAAAAAGMPQELAAMIEFSSAPAV